MNWLRAQIFIFHYDCTKMKLGVLNTFGKRHNITSVFQSQTVLQENQKRAEMTLPHFIQKSFVEKYY